MIKDIEGDLIVLKATLESLMNTYHLSEDCLNRTINGLDSSKRERVEAGDPLSPQELQHYRQLIAEAVERVTTTRDSILDVENKLKNINA